MTSAVTHAPRAIIQARWAVAAIFAVHGAVSGSLAARIPWIADNLSMSEGQLGLALMMPAFGAIISMPFTGRLVQIIGGRTATRILISGWVVALMIIPWAPNRWALMAILFLAGAAAGTADVAMNAEAVAVEERLGRAVMSGFHGMWSVGGMIGGGIGVAAGYASVSAPANFAAVGIALLAAGILAGHWLLPTVPVEAGAAGPRFSFPRGAVLIIGLIGFCAVFAEGATADWAAVYLQRVLSAGEGQAAVGYTMFAMAMAVGRLAGDAVVRRLGAVSTVRGTAALGVVGGALVVFSRHPLLAIAGFALIGLGIAVVVPLVFSAAGRTGDSAAHSIAGVATIAYGAGLAAPGLMGGIAQLTSLPISFGVVTVLIAVVFLGARRLAPAGPDTASS